MQQSTQIVAGLMHQPVVTVGPAASVEEVRAVAEREHIHHVPIVQSGKLLGMVCTCDLETAASGVRVLQLARRNVVTAEPNQTPAEVAKLMRDNAVGSVLIANRDGIWGIVTRDDLAHADAELAALLAGFECAMCHSTHHLRQSDGEGFVCASCADRASSSHWFDEGAGD